jgi:hypothetical protein
MRAGRVILPRTTLARPAHGGVRLEKHRNVAFWHRNVRTGGRRGPAGSDSKNIETLRYDAERTQRLVDSTAGESHGKAMSRSV